MRNAHEVFMRRNEEDLRSRGRARTMCVSCGGSGARTNPNGTKIPSSGCWECGGRGYKLL